MLLPHRWVNLGPWLWCKGKPGFLHWIIFCVYLLLYAGLRLLHLKVAQILYTMHVLFIQDTVTLHHARLWVTPRHAPASRYSGIHNEQWCVGLDFFRTSVTVGRRLVVMVSSCSSSVRRRLGSLHLEVGEGLLYWAVRARVSKPLATCSVLEFSNLCLVVFLATDRAEERFGTCPK